jgi:protein TonB
MQIWNYLKDGLFQKNLSMKNHHWEDLLFENRNKAYGAYELRVNYESRLNRSFVITLSSIALLMALVIILKNQKTSPQFLNTVPKEKHDMSETFQVMQNQLLSNVDKPAQKSEPASKNTSIPDIHNFKPVTALQPVDPIKPISGNPDPEPIDPGEAGQPIAGPANTSGTPFSNPAETTSRNIASVDVIPEFPGGIEKFYSYLMESIRYSDLAREMQINTRIYVSFVVGTDGKIKNIFFKNKPEAGLDQSIIAALEKCPVWKPGVYHGENVNTEMVLPVKFVIR